MIAVLCSDLHLSHKPPVARADEPDWYEAMTRPLNRISQLSDELDCPVIVAGDIFDKWNPPPELINFAIEELPSWMFAIPGQHDLPFHRYEDRHKSAYWTLVQSGRIETIEPRIAFKVSGDLTLHGFPWGFHVCALEEPWIDDEDVVHLAVVHSYVWDCGKNAYPNAPIESKVPRYSARLSGYDAAVFGDNHKGFLSEFGNGKPLLNCGTFMRRRVDEVHYNPHVGLLLEDGGIELYYLDTSKDKFSEQTIVSSSKDQSLDLTPFLNELGDMEWDVPDFVQAVKRMLAHNKISPEAKHLILQAIESNAS